MKLPLKWIKKYTNIDMPASDYVSKMILAGNAVEEVIPPEASGIVVGLIQSVIKHPNSDHLLICKVDVGEPEPLQIVTGASNVFEGAYVPVAIDGAKLPGGKVIKKGKLRGEVSQGMMCGGEELCVPDHLYPGAGVDGILIFNEPHELGTNALDILGIGDTIIDFEVLANRPDCLSAYGIARETAAVLKSTFNAPSGSVKVSGGKPSDHVSIDVRDGDLCPRYCAAVVVNVKIAQSPMWIREALHGAGIRSINNIVDITNYVMMETGHPMHAFDLSKVRGSKIVVRRANEGEILTTLDGKERTLTNSMLVIADGESATGLAGIMGGEESEITENTKAIMFECAAFDRTNIRLSSRALGLRTESSGRFERGVTPLTAKDAITRALNLVNELDAGQVVGENERDAVIDIYPNPAKPTVVRGSCDRIRERIGVDVPNATMAEILSSLHFDVRLDGDTLEATVPDFRQDVEMEADLSEEILRIYGYHHLKPTLPIGEMMAGGRNARLTRDELLKHTLLTLGANEIIGFSFQSRAKLQALGLSENDVRANPIEIRNPLGEDTAVMRTSLVPFMLDALATNEARRNDAALLFELSTVFTNTYNNEEKKAGELPFERRVLCVGAYGDGFDFYRMRGVAEYIASMFEIKHTIKRAVEPYHHPGRAATLTRGGNVIASLGEVHPEAAAKFGLTRRAYILEIDVDALPTPRDKKIVELPKFPASSRDVSMIMDESVQLGDMQDAIVKSCGAKLESVRLFDVYRSDKMPGKKSAAFALVFRSLDHTMTDDETNALFEKMVKDISGRFNAEIRSK